MTEISREEWLAKRRSFIGASEVAAVMGVSPFQGPLDVYLSKISDNGFHGNRATRRGQAMEPVIADWYAEETGRVIRDIGATAIQVHPHLPFLSATLDRVIVSDDGNAPLEIKSVGGFQSRDEWETDPPVHYQVQVQVQMAVTRATWGALCGGFAASDEIVHRDLQFDADFFAAAVPILEEFWARVQRRDPPPAGELPGALNAVKRAFSAVSPDKIVALPADVLSLVDEWESLKKAGNEAKKKADTLEARIREMMKDAEYAALDDGHFLSLKTATRKGYVVSDCEYRTLRKIKKLK
jgi:putative phage-type endonuclease